MKTGIPLLDELDDRAVVEMMSERTVLAQCHKQLAQELYTLIQIATAGMKVPPIDMRRMEMAAVIRLARLMGLADESLLIPEGII